MLYFIGDRQIYVGRSFKDDNGVTYAKQWFTVLSAAEKTAAGITEQAEPATYDARFYDSSGNPLALVDVKARAIATIKGDARFKFGVFDWYYIRKLETDEDVPNDVLLYRASLRTVCTAREAVINAAADVAALETAYNALDTTNPWPSQPISAYAFNT